jgi:hypothetical protein
MLCLFRLVGEHENFAYLDFDLIGLSALELHADIRLALDLEFV